ncbi:hypothetical protein PMAYCL1PPCAC_30582, partial [Pristionchus mayeri]
IHLIAINSPVNGNFGGRRGADVLCNKQAKSSGFHATFRAFLASSAQDIGPIVHREDNSSVVVNAKGEMLFSTWKDFMEGAKMSNAPIYTFEGVNIERDPKWPIKRAWVGSNSRGMRDISAQCEGWRSHSSDDIGLAAGIKSMTNLSYSNRKISCDTKLVLLCVEVR